jgi:hypothetical protein
VALKLALNPRDPRFEREAEMLSRIRHPGVPRLIDAGQWRHFSGFLHPYVVMEWVPGEPLYAWVSRHNPSSRQVLRLLARGARALQATHDFDWETLAPSEWAPEEATTSPVRQSPPQAREEGHERLRPPSTLLFPLSAARPMSGWGDGCPGSCCCSWARWCCGRKGPEGTRL